MAENKTLELASFLPYQLVIAAERTSQALSGIYTERHNFGVPEWRVLATLGRFDRMNARDIGKHSYMHKTKVSRAVSVLERRQLILRHRNDKDLRESPLSLTKKGRAVYEELSPLALQFEARVLEAIDPADREAFRRALKQITEQSSQLTSEKRES